MARMRGQDTMRSACKYYARTGLCRYGDNCRFAHELPQPAPALRQWCSAAEVCKADSGCQARLARAGAAAQGLGKPVSANGEAVLVIVLCAHAVTSFQP